MLYEDYECPFELLLTSSGSVCIHAKEFTETNDRNLQLNLEVNKSS